MEVTSKITFSSQVVIIGHVTCFARNKTLTLEQRCLKDTVISEQERLQGRI